MPAEWEPHDATWIAWPHNRSDWPGKFETIPWIYAEIVRHLTRVERVNILVDDEPAEAKARAVLVRAHVLPEKASAPGKPAGNFASSKSQPIECGRAITARSLFVAMRAAKPAAIRAKATSLPSRPPRGDSMPGPNITIGNWTRPRRRNRQTSAVFRHGNRKSVRWRTAPHRARGRQHRRQRPRHADHYRRVFAQRYSAAQPWSFA